MRRVCDESMARTKTSLLTSDHQSKVLNEVKTELSKIRDDIRLLETQEFGRLTQKLSKAKDDIEHAKIEGAEQILRLRSGFLLDMDLEKHRVEAEATELLKELDQARDKIQNEVDKMNLRMQQIKDSTRSGVAKGLGVIFVSALAFNLYDYHRKQ